MKKYVLISSLHFRSMSQDDVVKIDKEKTRSEALLGNIMTVSGDITDNIEIVNEAEVE